MKALVNKRRISHLVEMDVAKGSLSNAEDLFRTVSFRPADADDNTLSIKYYSLQKVAEAWDAASLCFESTFTER